MTSASLFIETAKFFPDVWEITDEGERVCLRPLWPGSPTVAHSRLRAFTVSVAVDVAVAVAD